MNLLVNCYKLVINNARKGQRKTYHLLGITMIPEFSGLIVRYARFKSLFKAPNL
jgi:hypothetical protein